MHWLLTTILGLLAAGNLARPLDSDGRGAAVALGNAVRFVIEEDGAVVAADGAADQPVGGTGAQPVRYDWGLPRIAPQRRWQENDTLPIWHTQWEQKGIRYTQSVLMTRLEGGDLSEAGPTPSDVVLMVQIVGENLAAEYTEGTAALGVQVGGRRLNLELRDGLAYVAGTNGTVLLAAIDIPAAGIAATNGAQLRFRGNMPPGNTGSMTFKLPFGRLSGEAQLEKLRDLDFADELRRVKAFWTARAKAGLGAEFPLRFREVKK